MEKVSANTITQLTIAHAFPSSTPAGPEPTAQQMIGDIRARLSNRIGFLAQSLKKSNGASAYSISHKKAVAELEKFDNLVNNTPKGFRLAPVLYSRIETKQNEKVYSQFSSYVRREFMRYLANNHVDELKALGIAPEGIARMKAGLDAVNAQGHMYAINIDHIIERFGGGQTSLTKAVDPLMPAGSHPTYLVNHFSNLILLPMNIHELKNTLNELQDAAETPYGENKWVLMLVPEASPPHSGYIAQPQSHPLLSLGLRHMRPVQLAETTVLQIEGIFESIEKAPEQRATYEAELKTALQDLSRRLKNAFNDVSKPRQRFKPFADFYEGKEFNALRQKVDALPAEQAKELRETMKWIDSKLVERFNHYASSNRTKNPSAPLTRKERKQARKLKRHSNGSKPRRR